MRTNRLSADEFGLLREVIEARAPTRADELLERVRANALTPAERMHLCELIGAELGAVGLKPDSEPTSKGKRLENLLDAVNRPNIVER